MLKNKLSQIAPVLSMVALFMLLLEYSKSWEQVHSWTLLLIVIGIIAVLIFPFLRKLSITLPSAIILYAIGMALFTPDSEIVTFLQWVAELLFVICALIIARWLAITLTNGRSNVILTSGSSYRVHLLKTALHQIELELIRCRRYGHPLAVIAMHFNLPPDIEEQRESQPLTELAWRGSVARVLSGSTRLSDLIIEPEDNTCFLVILPEIDEKGTNQFLERFTHITSGQADFNNFKSSIAVFPKDGITFDAVREIAQSRLNEKLNSVP